MLEHKVWLFSGPHRLFEHDSLYKSFIWRVFLLLILVCKSFVQGVGKLQIFLLNISGIDIVYYTNYSKSICVEKFGVREKCILRS